MKQAALIAAIGCVFALPLAGCSEKTEEAAETAASSAAQDTQRNVQKAGEAVENTAEKAGEAVENTAEAAGQTVKEGAQVVERGAEHVGEAVGGAVKGAAKEAQDAGQSAALTPKIKNALVADKSIDASTIDVDTSGEKDTVVLKGTVRSQAEKQKAETVARKALQDANSSFKLRNDLTVGGGAKKGT